MDGNDADAVLGAVVDVAREVFTERLVAVYALGSLAHGGFAPLVSDVDVALVPAVVDARTRERVAAVGAAVRERAPGTLADRLSVFWADPEGVRHGPGPHGRLPAVDRLDLIDSGRLLHGRDATGGAVRPDGPTLVREGAEFAVSRFDDDYLDTLRDPARLVAGGARTVTKAVLFPVRFLHTLHTHRIGLNADAVEHYAGPHRALVAAAAQWREHGLSDPVRARVLLAAHLTGLHTEFLDAYAEAMDRAGETGPATDLRYRRARLS
ncbi:hypothetical protein [Pseudonocardia sp. KRD291]|uniref:hypothetical protein n=1 Tax=Pseudonocardia sp. KRD291 TaxID=2792007 RepID=UPI001C4A20B2|nr:hypothetical protein [Pseudonocardia sp. KRD291]MBW0101134.1 hypothetical protein [Pseudonocardia sp. KRD291]